MGPEEQNRETLVEFVLALLEERLPWLVSKQDEPVSGADTVDELAGLYQSLIEEHDQPSRKAASPES